MATCEDIIPVFKKRKGTFTFSPTFHERARHGGWGSMGRSLRVYFICMMPLDPDQAAKSGLALKSVILVEK